MKWRDSSLATETLSVSFHSSYIRLVLPFESPPSYRAPYQFRPSYKTQRMIMTAYKLIRINILYLFIIKNSDAVSIQCKG